MRNIVIIFLLAFVALVVSGQDKKHYVGAGGALSSVQYDFSYTGFKAIDSVTTNQDSVTVQFKSNKPEALYYDFKTKILETTACKVAVSLQGRKFTDDAWSNITTTQYYGGGSDTTINFSQTSTKQFYTEWRILYKFVAGKARPSYASAFLKY